MPECGILWYLESWKLSKINSFIMCIKQLHTIFIKMYLEYVDIKDFFPRTLLSCLLFPKNVHEHFCGSPSPKLTPRDTSIEVLPKLKQAVKNRYVKPGRGIANIIFVAQLVSKHPYNLFALF